ncbi:hypothetical protein [Bradyrhizobium sp. IAR9]|nr:MULTISPECIES: hypothetical protein [unclassified Bradyrhizobium]
MAAEWLLNLPSSPSSRMEGAAPGDSKSQLSGNAAAAL